jgi:hypothetical protein
MHEIKKIHILHFLLHNKVPIYIHETGKVENNLFVY